MADSNYWTRNRRYTRRGFIRGAGFAAGVVTLAPVVAACGSNSNKNNTGSSSSASGTAATTGGTAAAGATKAAANGPKPVKGGTLTIRSFSDVSVLDYAFNHDVYSGFVIGNCVEPLMTVDTQAQPKGLLATSVENPDDRTYVFKLRQGVKFQDGTDFNADAVEYSMNRIHTDKTSFRYQDLIYIDKIEKPDQSTVKITLTNPYAPFLYNLTGDAGRVISPATGQKLGKDKLSTDLTDQGTGPYKFVEWKTGDHVTLQRNENYWNKDASGTQLPYLDKILFRVIPDDNVALAALRSGEVDAFRPAEGPPPKDTATVKSDASLLYKAIPGLGFNYIVFNESKDPFGSKELRQAVSYAIDRSVIAKNVLFDTAIPLDVIFAPSIWTYDPSYQPYLKRDLAKAKQLLAQAGKPNGFAFTYLTSSGSPTGQQTAELIKDQLKEAGMDMSIQQVEFAKLTQALTAGEHQAGNIGWSAGYDPDGWVYNHFSTKGSSNVRSHYSNPQVDQLLEQARTTLDQAKRKPLYQQAQQIFMGDAVFCVLTDGNTIDLSTRKVQNYPIGPTSAVGVSEVWKTA
ncbi:MAG: ABC transporter substrate-binding protein [Dehalococcoidia bacterium]